MQVVEQLLFVESVLKIFKISGNNMKRYFKDTVAMSEFIQMRSNESLSGAKLGPLNSNLTSKNEYYVITYQLRNSRIKFLAISYSL